MGGYAKYVATRDNVEKLEDKTVTFKSTESQEELIEKLIKDFPQSIHSIEYLTYKESPNIFRDKLDDENRRTIYTHAVDKRIRREDEAKRNAEILYD